MIAKSYISYKEQKLRKSEFQSEFETKAVYIIKTFNIRTRFILALLKKDAFEYAKVEVSAKKLKDGKDNLLFKITEVQSTPIANPQQIDEIPEITIPVFLFPNRNIALSEETLEMLRQKMPYLSLVTDVVKYDSNSTKGRLLINYKMIASFTIETQLGTLSLLDFLFKKESDMLPLTVPQDEPTLSSVFCATLTWRDILPSPNAYDRNICGVNCMAIRLRTIIDAYQNIFLLSSDTLGNEKMMCIFDAVGDSEHNSYVNKAENEKSQEMGFLIDTNTFIYEPEIVEKIHPGCTVYLPQKVISEIDGLKKNEKTQEMAKRAIRSLGHTTRKLEYVKAATYLLPRDFPSSDPDNRILSCMLWLQQKRVNATLVTSDGGMKLKASSMNIKLLTLNDFHKSEFYINK